jgi:hypothetical protein
MSGRLWLVGGVVALLVLALGALLFFGLLLGLNGYSEAKGGAILLAYLGVIAVTLGLAIWGSVVGVQAVAARTGWSFWLLGPLTVATAALAALALMVLGAFVLLLLLS